jgi:hypothetical protein
VRRRNLLLRGARSVVQLPAGVESKNWRRRTLDRIQSIVSNYERPAGRFFVVFRYT